MARKSRICAEAYLVTPHKQDPQIDAAIAKKNRFRSERRVRKD
jgi:hypothetical protein